MLIKVYGNGDDVARGRVVWPGGEAQCALGRGGIRRDKREGDGATPVGAFLLRRALYRQDRLSRPQTKLPLKALRPDDGWSDDPADPFYNRPVTRPHPFSHETLWRADNLYDVIVVIGHNDAPVIPGHGSAVFIHLATVDYSPTAGCVAVAAHDLLGLLATCRPGDVVEIIGPGSAA